MEAHALIFPGSAESKEQFDIKNGVSLFCGDDLSSFEKKTSKSLAWSNWNHHQITCIKKNELLQCGVGEHCTSDTI